MQVDSDAEDSDAIRSIHKKKKAKQKSKKQDTHKLSDFDDSDFEDLEEVKDTRKSGGKLHPLFPKVSRICQKKNPSSTDKKNTFVRCIASRACGTHWAYPHNKKRILGHAANVDDCGSMPEDLRSEAIAAMAVNAIGPPFQMPGASQTHNNSNTMASAVLKRTRTESDVGSVQGPSSKKPSLDVFITVGHKELKENGDYALMLLFACCGIPPTVVDSSEFKRYTSTLNSAYKPPSSTTLSQKLIPEEAAKILQGMIEFLKTCRNCTISFDGGKTRKPKGLYTIHITTADRHSFCVEIDDASCPSHTANYVFEILARACLTIHLFMPSNSHHHAFDRT